MVRLVLPLVFALLLGAATQPAVPPALATADGLSAVQRHDMRCAAAFAVVAVAQTRGDAAALALPPLGIRGKHYLGLVGERVADETGLSGDAVHSLLVNAAKSVAHDGATAIAGSCLAELDVAVPPHPAPDAVKCFALLGAYADVLAKRDAADPMIAVLRRQAAALEALAHVALRSHDRDPATAAAELAMEQDRMARALRGFSPPGQSDSVDADDFALCRRMAGAKAG